jgi:hypothetical protein
VAWEPTVRFCLRLLPKWANGLLVSARSLLELWLRVRTQPRAASVTVGEQTIRNTQIVFLVNWVHSVTATSVAAISEIAESATQSWGCKPTGESIAPDRIPATFAHYAQNACSTAAQTPAIISALHIESEHLLGVAPIDDDEIDYDKSNAFSNWNSDSNTTETEPSVLDQIQISGSDYLQTKLIVLWHLL